MKRSPHFCFPLLLSLSAFALDQGHALYVGGTVPGVTAGVVGRLDPTSATSLTSNMPETKWRFPTPPSSRMNPPKT
jgi:hypothetical protein